VQGLLVDQAICQVCGARDIWNTIGDSARFVQQKSMTDKREYIAALMTQETHSSFNGIKLLSSNDRIIALNSCRTCASSLHKYKTINSIVGPMLAEI